MPFIGSVKKIEPNLTNAPLSMFLLANAFVWYLCTFKFLQDAMSSAAFTGNSLIVITFNFLTFVLSAFLGTKLVEHFNKRKTLLKYWMLFGIVVSCLFAVVNLADFASLILLAGIIGVYFGLGMPTFMGYFAASTEPQNRAKFGGATVLLIVLSFPLISLVGVSEPYLTSSILAIWLAVGLILLSYFKPAEKQAEAKDRISFRSVISNKTFILYIVPWLMISLVNDLTMQINDTHFISLNLPSYYILIENVITGAFAIVCGFLADKKGRKRLALMGFALLGIGYAALGLFSASDIAAWFYVCADGIAWGAFTTLFITTLWGDIAQEKHSEKYYVLGVLPYLFSTLAGASIGNYVSQYLTNAGTNNEGMLFSLASFFLFAATLPLFYAPETLSDKIMRNKDLNNYVSKALEKVKKEDIKKQKHLQKKNVQENKIPEEKSAEISPEDIEAKRLAEKYY